MGWGAGFPKQLVSEKKIKENFNKLSIDEYARFDKIEDDLFWFEVDVPTEQDLWENNKTYFMRIPVYKLMDIAEKIINKDRMTLKDLENKIVTHKIELYRLTWYR